MRVETNHDEHPEAHRVSAAQRRFRFQRFSTAFQLLFRQQRLGRRLCRRFHLRRPSTDTLIGDAGDLISQWRIKGWTVMEAAARPPIGVRRPAAR